MVEEKAKEDGWFPIRFPKELIKIMDEFKAAHPELGVSSRQELARRAVAEWIMMKRRECYVKSNYSRRLPHRDAEDT